MEGRYQVRYKDLIFYGNTPEEAQRKRDEYIAKEGDDKCPAQKSNT